LMDVVVRWLGCLEYSRRCLTSVLTGSVFVIAGATLDLSETRLGGGRRGQPVNPVLSYKSHKPPPNQPHLLLVNRPLNWSTIQPFSFPHHTGRVEDRPE
jgi:hypothetical protein